MQKADNLEDVINDLWWKELGFIFLISFSVVAIIVIVCAYYFATDGFVKTASELNLYSIWMFDIYFIVNFLAFSVLNLCEMKSEVNYLYNKHLTKLVLVTLIPILDIGL